MGLLLHAGAEPWPMLAHSTRHCETLQIAGLNTFAVRSIQLDEDARSRIKRAIDRQSLRPAEDDATAIDEEANDD